MAGEYSFDARFGRLIRSEGIATIPATLFSYQAALGLSAQEVWLICALLTYKWGRRDPYPSVHTLSRQSGIPRSTILTYLKMLKQKGIVDAIPRFSEEGRQTSSSYSFDGLFDKLEQLILDRGGSTHTTPEGRPADREGRMHRHEEEPTEEEPEKEERSDVVILAESIAWKMRKPAQRDEVAQKLLAFEVSSDRLKRAVYGALEELRVGEGEKGFWLAVRARLG